MCAFVRPRLVAITFGLAFAACGRVPLDLPAGGGAAGAAGTTSAGAAGAGGSVATGTAGTGATRASDAKCPGTACPSNQICCILDGTCIDPANAPSACPKPTEAPAFSIPGTRPCGSNADCAKNEFCGSETSCLGPGICQDRANCGTSTGPPFCGCDGATYANIQTACRAGVTTLGHDSACGVTQPVQGQSGDGRQPVTFCGHDDQCPTGQRCCAIYGTCLDASIPELCAPPPPGARVPCTMDLHCRNSEFCKGDGCEGPGGCVWMSPTACTGVLEPVCGCDGKTYTNADCTISAGVRIDHEGMCMPPPG